MPHSDEDEVEIIEYGTGELEEIHTGLHRAKSHAYANFLKGRTDVAQFEAEIERLLKIAQQRGVSL